MKLNMRMALRLLPLLLFVLLSVLLLHGLFSDPTKLSSARIGKPLPAFSLPLLNSEGGALVLADMSLLPPGPLLLNVWATWCPTCQAEHQFLNQLAAKGVTIVGLVYKDDAAKAQGWLARLGNPYQLVLHDANGRYGIELGVYGAPETYLIDSERQIRYRHVGDVNAKVWQQQLLPLWQQLQQEAQPLPPKAQPLPQERQEP